jgi:hypothetical protein
MHGQFPTWVTKKKKDEQIYVKKKLKVHFGKDD